MLQHPAATVSRVRQGSCPTWGLPRWILSSVTGTPSSTVPRVGPDRCSRFRTRGTLNTAFIRRDRFRCVRLLLVPWQASGNLRRSHGDWITWLRQVLRRKGVPAQNRGVARQRNVPQIERYIRCRQYIEVDMDEARLEVVQEGTRPRIIVR